MLDLKIEGKSVALAEDAELVVNLVNPVLHERTENNTFPFTVPIKPNRETFGFLDRHTQNETEEKFAKVEFAGRTILDANAIVSDISNKEIELFLSTDKTYFWTKYKEVLLNELDFGNLVTEDIKETLKTANSKDDQPFVSCVIRHVYDNELYRDINIYNEEQGPFSGEGLFFSPLIKLHYIVEQLFRQLGYNFNSLSKNYESINKVVFVNSNKYSPEVKNIPYKELLPAVKIIEWLKDLEKKFSLIFVVNEINQDVYLLDKYDFKETLILPCYDDISKKVIEKEDLPIYENIIHEDKAIEVTDDYLKLKESDIKYVLGNEKSKDVHKIEYISSTCLSEILKLCFPIDIPMDDKPVTLYRDVRCLQFETASFPLDRPIYAEYNGFKNSYLEFNSLSWNREVLNKKSLWERFHSYESKIKIYNIQTELNIKSDIFNLINPHELFQKIIVCHGQEYLVGEQSISLSTSNIVSHKVIAYPLRNIIT